MHTVSSVDIVKFMKKLGGLIGIILAMSIFIYLFSNELMVFVMTGQIPFTKLVLPPVTMLIFWLLVIPGSIIAWKIFDLSLWKIIESIGTLHQKYLNRKYRIFTPAISASTICLISSSLILLDRQSKKNYVSSSSMQRRLAPLPF